MVDGQPFAGARVLERHHRPEEDLGARERVEVRLLERRRQHRVFAPQRAVPAGRRQRRRRWRPTTATAATAAATRVAIAVLAPRHSIAGRTAGISTAAAAVIAAASPEIIAERSVVLVRQGHGASALQLSQVLAEPTENIVALVQLCRPPLQQLPRRAFSSARSRLLRRPVPLQPQVLLLQQVAAGVAGDAHDAAQRGAATNAAHASL